MFLTSWRFIIRTLGAFLAVAMLSACGLVEGDGRHLQPLSSVTEAQLRNIGSSPAQAMVIRIFKDESALEVWKQTSSGQYRLFKTYDICSYSGDLGPKFKEGDRQSPEGFYTITPGLMNPKSNYYLAFNTGFPNKFDRAWGRTGSDLMVHGDCSSRGCYAMTDEQIAEIYALGREAFRGGQRRFQLQAFPFRLTAENLAKHHASPHIKFWRDLKVGYDYFEIAKRPPEWDVCDKRYIFNAASNGALNARGACPTSYRDPKIMAQVLAKQSTDYATFQSKAGDYQEREAKKVANAEAAAVAKQESAERTAELNAVVKEKTDAVSDAVGGFFSGLFNGITGGESAEGADAPAKQTKAPIPAARNQS